jgi:DNA-directed RNA polymerase subunit RPC12/RpoP
MPADDPKFPCPACGKQYRWKPEMAGRTAKCTCGAKLVVPADPPRLAPPPAAPAAAKSTCPDCGAELPENAVLCVNCGFNLKTGKKLAAVVVETEDAEEEVAEKPVNDGA